MNSEHGQEDSEHPETAVDNISESNDPKSGPKASPYVELMRHSSFARCYLVGRPNGVEETFSRSFLPLGHGYPLFSAFTWLDRPEERFKEGIEIGDVGTIDEEGCFDFLFNIFLPATHPTQERIPPNFVPISPLNRRTHVRNDPQYHPPGTVLASKGIYVTRLPGGSVNLEFKVRAREGSIVVFPAGASREDLVSPTMLHTYIKQHTLSWYRFINDRRPTLSPNGSLYVVTGCDRSTEWALASCPFQCWLRYNSADKQPWQSTSGVMTRINGTDEKGNSSVIIRGMRVALSPTIWENEFLNNKPPVNLAHYNLLETPATGLRALYLARKEQPVSWKQTILGTGDLTVPFHPLDVVANVILTDSSSSAIAIVDDYMWASVSDNGDGSLPRIFAQLVRLFEAYEVVTEEDVVTLKKRTVAPTPTNILSSLNVSAIVRAFLLRRKRRAEIIRKIENVFPGPPPG